MDADFFTAEVAEGRRVFSSFGLDGLDGLLSREDVKDYAMS